MKATFSSSYIRRHAVQAQSVDRQPSAKNSAVDVEEWQEEAEEEDASAETSADSFFRLRFHRQASASPLHFRFRDVSPLSIAAVEEAGATGEESIEEGAWEEEGA